MGKTIGIKLRYDNFKSVTRDTTLDHYTADAQDIRQHAGLCLKRVALHQRLRLLGVRVGSLERQSVVQAWATQAPAQTATGPDAPQADLFAWPEQTAG